MQTRRDEYNSVGYTVFTPKDDSFRNLVSQCAKLSRDYVKPEFRKSRGFTLEDGVFNHILFPHHISHEYKDLIDSQAIGQILLELFGPVPLYVTHSKISYKFPNKEQVWLPHQDSGYKIRKCNGATVAIFLEDCSEEDGPLQVFPGSHKDGRLKHKRVLRPGDNNPQTTVVDLPPIESKPILGKMGDVLVFNMDTIHQSSPSRGKGFRSLFLFEAETIRFAAVESNGDIAMILNGEASVTQKLASAVMSPAQKMYSRGKTLGRVIFKELFPRV